MSLNDFLNKKLGLVPEEKPTKPESLVISNRPSHITDRSKKSPKKEILIKYILALNRGHKTYLKYGFNDNHAFLGEIIKIINEL